MNQNKESTIELTELISAPFKATGNSIEGVRRPTLERVKRYLQVVGLFVILLIYFSILFSALIKFFLDTKASSIDSASDVLSILNSINKEVIAIQATSSDSSPIIIIKSGYNGTRLESNFTGYL